MSTKVEVCGALTGDGPELDPLLEGCDGGVLVAGCDVGALVAGCDAGVLAAGCVVDVLVPGSDGEVVADDCGLGPPGVTAVIVGAAVAGAWDSAPPPLAPSLEAKLWLGLELLFATVDAAAATW